MTTSTHPPPRQGETPAKRTISEQISARGVEKLHRLFDGKAVLLPIPKGRKGPDRKGWQKTTLADTLEPSYQDQLARGNIGVLLGTPSGGVCSIDIDVDEEADRFLELNPLLAGALRSRGKRGCNVWVRIIGEFPPLTKIKTEQGEDWGEWRADGAQTVIHGTHPDGGSYHLLVDAPPAEIAFDDIVWPDHLVIPWRKTLEDIYGPAVMLQFNAKGGAVITGIGEAFWAGLYAEENIVLHEPAEKTFYRYDDTTGLYSPETPDAIKRDISARMLEESRREGMGGLVAFRTDTKLNGVVAALRGIAEERGVFDTRPETVHLANCVLRFHEDGFERCGFSPSFKSRNQSPIAYDPAARCPRFLGELIDPAVEPDDVLLLQKMIGQALLGRNLVQRFVILDGLGGRGKTQLANVIQQIVGKQNSTQLRTNLLNDRFELNRFVHRTLLTGIDVPADFLSTKGAQVIKGLCGGDFFDTEQKHHGGSFQMKGDFNIFITSNSRLKIHLAGDISAWRRRLTIVRYEAPPPKKKIPDFAEMLVEEEGSGILNWALEGLLMVRQEIVTTGDIQLTERQHSVVDSLLAESESLRHFLEKRVESVPARDLTVEEIVEAYADFCPEMGWNPQPITELQRDLPSLMLELFRTVKANDIKRDGKSRKGFRNVAFTGESEI